MNNFSDFVNDLEVSMKKSQIGSMTESEINQFLLKTNKIIPKPVQNIIQLTKKYDIMHKEELDSIRESSKQNLKKVYNDNFSQNHKNMTYDDFEELWCQLKDIKDQYKLLPQCMCAQTREQIMSGGTSIDDITMDLSAPQERNAIIKNCIPVLYGIVNHYLKISTLTRGDLIPIVLVSASEATDQWMNDIHGFFSRSSFKQYMIRYIEEVLNKKLGIQDNMPDIYKTGVEYIDSNEKDQWADLYRIIESNFKQRECDIFYRYFGLNGYRREKSKDLARSMRMSEEFIRSNVINKILTYLKLDKKIGDILKNIQQSYDETLMTELVGCGIDVITETLLNDDIFILLEDLTRWSDECVFVSSLNNVFSTFDKKDDVGEIINILKNNELYLEEHYKIYKKIIILFLNKMYPTECFSRKSDVVILGYVNELRGYFQKFGIRM